MKSAIGVFDSGVGGLTVLRTLRQKFPFQEFLYLGDTARLPYGSKSPETIRAYLLQNLHFLAARDVQAVVVACNSASTQLHEDIWEGLPVYNVIGPGSEAALSITEGGRIGLLGTRATVESGAYQKKIQELSSGAGRAVEIFAQACPLFVPLAEEGWVDDPVTNLIVYRYLQPLLIKQIDTLIMGCTHYPILRNSIERAAGKAVSLVDSGEAIALKLSADFQSGRLRKSTQGGLRLMMTDLSPHLQEWAQTLLGEAVPPHFEKVDL